MAEVLLIVLMTFLIGFLLLMLSFAYRSIESDRAASAAAPAHLHALDAPRFFANLTPEVTPDLAAVGPAILVQRLEEHVREEQQLVAEFAKEPSTARLFPDASSIVDAVTRELERRIEHEVAVVSAFVAAPTLDGLFHDVGLSAPVAVASK